MTTPNRDLLVLTSKVTMNAKQLEQQVELLNNLLFTAESVNVFCTVNEVIDLNKYKIITAPQLIQQIARQRTLKPFVFISNKN